MSLQLNIYVVSLRILSEWYSSSFGQVMDFGCNSNFMVGGVENYKMPVYLKMKEGVCPQGFSTETRQQSSKGWEVVSVPWTYSPQPFIWVRIDNYLKSVKEKGSTSQRNVLFGNYWRFSYLFLPVSLSWCLKRKATLIDSFVQKQKQGFNCCF